MIYFVEFFATRDAVTNSLRTDIEVNMCADMRLKEYKELVK